MGDTPWYQKVLEDEDEDEEAKKEHESYREYIVVLIDADKDMLVKEGERCCLDTALECAIALLRTKIICGANDHIGVCFFGTREKSNALNFDNVYTFLDIDMPDAQRIKALEGLSTRQGDEFTEKIGNNCENRGKALECGLRAASNLLQKGTTKGAIKRVLLFTCDDNPCCNASNTQQVLTRVKAMTELQHNLEILGMSTSARPFDINAFYKTMQADLCEEAIAESLQSMAQVMRQKITHKRRLRVLWMDLWGTKVAVGLYGLVLPATVGSRVQLEQGTLEEVVTETAMICFDTGALLTEVTKRSGRYGGKQVVVPEGLLAEVKQLLPVGIQVLGFLPTSELKDYHQVRRGGFFYPDEETGPGSTRTFVALFEALCKLDRMAMVWVQMSMRMLPRMGVLLPQQEERDEDNRQLRPPGLALVYLPFTDDLRRAEQDVFLEYPPPQKADSEMTATANNLVRTLNLAEFEPGDIYNPALQRHFEIIENLALEGDVSKMQTQDDTMPDLEGMQRAAGVVQAFKAAVYGSTHDAEEAAAAAAKGAAAAAAEKRKADQTAEALRAAESTDWKAAVQKGTLAKMTVAVLKNYLNAHKLPTDGKKDDLVKRIDLHVRTNNSL